MKKSSKAVKYIKIFFSFLWEVIRTGARYLVRTIRDKLRDNRKNSTQDKTQSNEVDAAAPSIDENETKDRGMISPAVVVLAAFVAVILTFYFTVNSYCRTHFLPNTVIAGVDVSDMTVNEAKEAINEQENGYTLTLVEKNGITETVTAQQLGLDVQTAEKFDDLLKSKSGYSWIKQFQGINTLDTKGAVIVEADSAVFDNAVSTLKCISPAVVGEPLDAVLYYWNGEFKIRPSLTGNIADRQMLEQKILDAVAHGRTVVNLISEDIYKNPTVSADDPELLARKSMLDPISGIDITIHFGANTEKLDPPKLSQWVVSNGSGSSSVDENAISEYVLSLADKYNTYSSTKPFVTTGGETVFIGNSYYGWELDTEYLYNSLLMFINERRSVDIDLTNRSEESDKYWVHVAAKYDPINYYGSTYAEVSIDGQYMWMYKNGELALASDVVTGRPDDEHDTPIGIYHIIYMEQNATLRGEDYETEVAYWMVFAEDIGFHDAEWQYAFGGEMYLENGSHGCVNLPIEVAERLYGLVYPGMPVFVY
ncbi:MAG: L,D-transpeptidase family protein [Clostridia bacterium]|nr:L,D-transpeptidase family protein [Clostridia bacterium]